VAKPRRDDFPNNFVGDLVPTERGWVVVPPTCCPDGHAYSDPGWSVSSVLVLTLAYTGIRWGEAVALRVRDVQFLRRRLSVHDNAVQIGARHELGRPKSRTERSVPVPQFVPDQLAVQCEGRGLADLVFGDDGATYLPRPKSSNGWFRRAVKTAGIQVVTPHDLRHTCASLAVSAGVNVLALARMLGHKDPSVTLRVYADLFDTDLDAVASALDLKCAQTAPNRHGRSLK
jgi:integrase